MDLSLKGFKVNKQSNTCLTAFAGFGPSTSAALQQYYVVKLLEFEWNYRASHVTLLTLLWFKRFIMNFKFRTAAVRCFGRYKGPISFAALCSLNMVIYCNFLSLFWTLLLGNINAEEISLLFFSELLAQLPSTEDWSNRNRPPENILPHYFEATDKLDDHKMKKWYPYACNLILGALYRYM